MKVVLLSAGVVEVRKHNSPWLQMSPWSLLVLACAQQRLQGDNEQLPIIISLGPTRDTLVDLAEQVLALSGQREALHLTQAEAGLILEKETAAASVFESATEGIVIRADADRRVIAGTWEEQRKSIAPGARRYRKQV